MGLSMADLTQLDQKVDLLLSNPIVLLTDVGCIGISDQWDCWLVGFMTTCEIASHLNDYLWVCDMRRFHRRSRGCGNQLELYMGGSHTREWLFYRFCWNFSQQETGLTLLALALTTKGRLVSNAFSAHFQFFNQSTIALVQRMRLPYQIINSNSFLLL